MENFNEILNTLSTIVANVAECKLREVQDLQQNLTYIVPRTSFIRTLMTRAKYIVHF